MKRAASSTTGASAEEEYGKSESDPLIDSNNKQAHTVRRSRWYHTSFVIMAEVMGFEDFETAGSEAQCKADGKYRQQGKTYIVKDGDIIFFKFNTPSAPNSIHALSSSIVNVSGGLSPLGMR